MAADRDEILADRLNVQPAIFRGCSSSELGAIVGIGAAIWLPICVVVAGMLGNFAIGFSAAGIMIGVTVVIIATIFQKVKRNRPDAYYQHLLVCFFEDLGVWRSRFIRKTGYWALGRTVKGRVTKK